ncbi:hypothetical protein JST99_03105 [Candidatus Dependentiae bacterium]|nr:hypothetical protein [Candidatus Dependentiae bacterium]MCC7414971.1 hypothetical protein [Campylobacterota bacterium]
MYKQYKTVLAGIIFLCAPTAALAELTLTDAAIVLVPAVLGVCGGYGAVKHSINSERSELELKRQKLLRMKTDLTASNDLLQHQKNMFAVINERTSRSSVEIKFLDDAIRDGDQTIHWLNQKMEQVKLLMHKNRLNKEWLESRYKNVRAFYRIDELDFQFHEYEQSLRAGEVELEDIRQTQELFERTKKPAQMTSADREFFGWCIKGLDQMLQKVSNDLQVVREDIEEAAEDLKEITSDESRRLRNGALLGGAVGGVAGLAVLGGVKYAPDARDAREKREKNEHLFFDRFYEIQQRKEDDRLFNASTVEDKLAFCWLNKINPHRICTEKDKILFKQEMAEWINLEKPNFDRAEAEWVKQGRLPVHLLERMMHADWKPVLNCPTSARIIIEK